MPTRRVTGERDPHRCLALAILERALLDLQLGGALAADTKAFFDSEWCACVAELAGVNVATLRRAAQEREGSTHGRGGSEACG